MLTKTEPATVNYSDYLAMWARNDDEIKAIKAAMKKDFIDQQIIDKIDLNKNFEAAANEVAHLGCQRVDIDFASTVASIHRAILKGMNLQIDKENLMRSVLDGREEYSTGWPTDGTRYVTSDGWRGTSVGRLPIFTGQNVLVRDDGTMFLCGGFHLERE